MELFMVIMCVFGLMALLFWLEHWVERIERRNSRARHPSSRYCDECAMRVEDWETHQRLAHAPRVRAPDDML